MRNESGIDCRDVDMTEATQGPTFTMTDDRKLTEAEIEAFQRDQFLADPAIPADQCPRLWNISAGMLYDRLVRALEPSPAEYVTVSLPRGVEKMSSCLSPSRNGTSCGKLRSSGAACFLKKSSRFRCAR